MATQSCRAASPRVMCGIFGQVGAPLDDDRLSAVEAALHHRGPDSWGVRRLDGATLLHTRLRILDLSAAGAQPMSNEDGSVWVTFNGEIYTFAELRRELEALGHVFRSRSDTEVIVHGYEQWGDDVVRRIDGMFAFGLWDQRRRRLLVARDRVGKKPLFYARVGDEFLFGSEIKALVASGLPSEPDDEGIAGYLAFGYAPAAKTVYRGVAQLPPAHLMTLDEGAREPRIVRYWNPSFSPSAPVPDEETAARTVRKLLTDAVARRVVADVPVGAFLSGGVDSTIIVGLMASLGQKVKTFSIGFRGDERYDETSFARAVAARFGTDHHEYWVEPSDFNLLEKLVWHHDGPFGDSSALPTYVVAQRTRADVTVALTGDGGDELFAGYLRFWAAAFAERIPPSIRRISGFLGALLSAGRPERSTLARARRFFGGAARALPDRLLHWGPYLANSLEDALQPDRLPHGAGDVARAEHAFFDQGAAQTPLARALAHNFHTYLPGDLLVKTDRMTMAHALEARSPFLDTALIDYVTPLPDHYKLRGRTTKYLLRKAFSDLIPKTVDRRAKMGFGVPLGTWFKGSLAGYLRDHLASSSTRIYDYVRPGFVGRMIDEHLAGTSDHSHRLWALLTLEIWLRRLRDMGRPWEHQAPVPSTKSRTAAP